MKATPFWNDISSRTRISLSKFRIACACQKSPQVHQLLLHHSNDVLSSHSPNEPGAAFRPAISFSFLGMWSRNLLDTSIHTPCRNTWFLVLFQSAWLKMYPMFWSSNLARLLLVHFGVQDQFVSKQRCNRPQLVDSSFVSFPSYFTSHIVQRGLVNC